MKLINADKYQKALEAKAKEISNEDTINGICGAVALLFEQEDVLDKIRAELTEEKESYEKVGNWKKAYGFEKSIEIIEQYVKGESE